MKFYNFQCRNTFKKDINRDSHIASSPITQSLFFEGVRCLVFGFLTEEASWTHRIFKIWYHDKKNEKIQIHLNFKGLDRFSQNWVSNIT